MSGKRCSVCTFLRPTGVCGVGQVHGYLRAPLVNNAVNAPVRLAHLLAVPSE